MSSPQAGYDLGKLVPGQAMSPTYEAASSAAITSTSVPAVSE